MIEGKRIVNRMIGDEETRNKSHPPGQSISKEGRTAPPQPKAAEKETVSVPASELIGCARCSHKIERVFKGGGYECPCCHFRTR